MLLPFGCVSQPASIERKRTRCDAAPHRLQPAALQQLRRGQTPLRRVLEQKPRRLACLGRDVPPGRAVRCWLALEAPLAAQHPRAHRAVGAAPVDVEGMAVG